MHVGILIKLTIVAFGALRVKVNLRQIIRQHNKTNVFLTSSIIQIHV